MNDINEYFEREAEIKVKKWLASGYITALIGPRQVGKTTLIQKTAKELKIQTFYYNFDDVLLRGKVARDFYFLQKDIEARLGKSLDKINKEKILLIIDEAQKGPSVFDYIKILHEKYGAKVKIAISGSSSLELQKKSAESLAGRCQYVYLYALSISEILKAKFGIKSKTSLFNNLFNPDFSLLKKEYARFYPQNMELYESLKEILVFGLLPGVWSKPKDERFDYLRSIVSLYLDKDIRAAGLVKELENFQHLLEILSFQVGSAWNLSNLSTQIQTSVNTLRAHRSILNNTFVLNFVYPYVRSPQKSVVKSPKCYFYDIGVANYLAGRERIENVFDSKSSGGIFENIIIKSFEAWNSNETMACKTYFWRNYEDREIDFLVEKAGKIVPVEITLSRDVVHKKVSNLECFMKEKKCDFGFIVYTGELKAIKLKNAKTILCVPWYLWQ
ncbi:MAG: AAA family ATPase [bacterium]|nr:AAA family ATPase [bacterium]